MLKINTRTADGVCVIELNDPPANTYSYEMMQEFDAAVLAARMDAAVHVIVLRGAGEKFFCAGANIGMLKEADPDFKYYFCLHANETLNWQYEAEVLPFALEGDPLMQVVVQEIKPQQWTQTHYDQSPMARCHSSDQLQFTYPDGTQYEYLYTYTCNGREWTFGEAISPMGFRLNFTPHRRLQPMLLGHGGYMYSTHPIPTPQSGSFNFRFDVGAGFEVFRTRAQSIRVEYRLQHVSNKNTATANPGIDSQVLHVAYVFGR